MQRKQLTRVIVGESAQVVRLGFGAVARGGREARGEHLGEKRRGGHVGRAARRGHAARIDGERVVLKHAEELLVQQRRLQRQLRHRVRRAPVHQRLLHDALLRLRLQRTAKAQFS